MAGAGSPGLAHDHAPVRGRGCVTTIPTRTASGGHALRAYAFVTVKHRATAAGGFDSGIRARHVPLPGRTHRFEPARCPATGCPSLPPGHTAGRRAAGSARARLREILKEVALQDGGRGGCSLDEVRFTGIQRPVELSDRGRKRETERLRLSVSLGE